MAPATDERPLTAQEAFLKQQREQRERGDEPAPLPEQIETGPNAVHGYDTDDSGEPSVHGVINSPYLKDRIAKGSRIGGPGVGDTAGRNVIDRSAAGQALGVEEAEKARQEAEAKGVEVEDGDTRSQAAAADKAETHSVEGHPTGKAAKATEAKAKDKPEGGQAQS